MHYSEVPDHNPPSKAILEYDLDFIVLQCRFQLPAVNGFNPFTKVPCLRHCKKNKDPDQTLVFDFTCCNQVDFRVNSLLNTILINSMCMCILFRLSIVSVSRLNTIFHWRQND